MLTPSNLPCSWSASNFFFGSVFFLSAPWLWAQNGNATTDGFIVNIAAKTAIDGSAYTSNPSLNSLDSVSALRLEVFPSRFQLPELQTARLSSSLHWSQSLSSILCVSSMGSELYREIECLVSLATRLSTATAFGTAVRMVRVQAKNYEAINVFSFDAGLTTSLSTSSRIAAVVQNLSRASAPEASQTVRQFMSLGYGLDISPDLCTDVDYVVQLNRTTSLRAALRYTLANVASIRLAFDTASPSCEVDLRIEVQSSLSAYIMTHVHQYLGMSMGGGVMYQW